MTDELLRALLDAARHVLEARAAREAAERERRRARLSVVRKDDAA